MKVNKEWLLSGARKEAEKYYDPETKLCLIPRETAWYAITLLMSDEKADQKFGNELLSQLSFNDGTHSPCTLYVIHKKLQHRLTKSCISHIKKEMKNNLSIASTVRFSEGNVNHPVAAFAALICCGELFDDKVYTQFGMQQLEQFYKSTCKRQHGPLKQAEMSEYNSPTYTALTLWFLSIIAEYAQDKNARELALLIEQKLWLNVAMHWHEPTQQFCGPFSRAYSEDSLGGFSALHCTFGYALDKDIFLDPDLPVQYVHPSALIENAFIALLDFHLPPKMKKMAFEKPLPYYVQKTTYCEQYHENLIYQQKSSFYPDIYPGGWGDLTSYLTDEFCMGTASRPYVNAAQTDSFSVRIRCNKSIQHVKDFRGVYSRMVYNGSTAGQANFCHVSNYQGSKDYLYEEGRVFTYQHQNKAIVAYTPKRVGHKNVTEIRLDIIFTYNKPFDYVQINDRPVKKFPFTCKSVNHILIRDYNTNFIIFPLNITPLENYPGSVRLWSTGKLFIISFYNFKGARKDFTKAQISQTFNGFACILENSDNKKAASLLEQTKVTDEINKPFTRCIQMQNPDFDMKFCYDPLAERIESRTFNNIPENIQHLTIKAPENSDPFFTPKELY